MASEYKECVTITPLQAVIFPKNTVSIFTFLSLCPTVPNLEKQWVLYLSRRGDL